MSDHAWVQEHVAAYLAGGLDAQEAERLEAHARDCPACGAALAEGRTLDRGLRACSPALRPDPGLEDRAVARLRTAPPASGRCWAGGRSGRAPWPRCCCSASSARSPGRSRRTTVCGCRAEPSEAARESRRRSSITPPEQAAGREGRRDGTRWRASRARSGESCSTAVGSRRRRHGHHGRRRCRRPNARTAIAPRPKPSARWPPTAIPGTATGMGMGMQPGMQGMGMGMGQGMGIRPRPTVTIPPPAACSDPASHAGEAVVGRSRRVRCPRPFDPKSRPAASTRAAQSEPIPNRNPAARPLRTRKRRPSIRRRRTRDPNPEPQQRHHHPLRRHGVRGRVVRLRRSPPSPSSSPRIKGAFVATVNSEKLPNGKVKGSVTVRVPPEHLDGLVLDLRRELGKGGELKGVQDRQPGHHQAVHRPGKPAAGRPHDGDSGSSRSSRRARARSSSSSKRRRNSACGGRRSRSSRARSATTRTSPPSAR